MRKRENLIGKKFNRLTVVEFVRYDSNGDSYWLCECDCRNKSIVKACNLKSNGTKSCGCFRKEKTFIHGMAHSPLNNVWKHIKQRCSNPRNDDYKNYGGRGIKVCDEWVTFLPFYLWAMENGYKKGLTIERKNNNKGYSPENCVWATRKEQNNNKRNNKFISFKGVSKTVKGWADSLGISRESMRDRLKHSPSLEDALTTPRLAHRRRLCPRQSSNSYTNRE